MKNKEKCKRKQTVFVESGRERERERERERNRKKKGKRERRTPMGNVLRRQGKMRKKFNMLHVVLTP